MPQNQPQDDYVVMKEPVNQDYQVNKEDFPFLRAVQCWLSPEENDYKVLPEINIFVNVFADVTKLTQTIGRSSKSDIQIKLNAMSANHCQITYTKERGWFI